MDLNSLILTANENNKIKSLTNISASTVIKKCNLTVITLNGIKKAVTKPAVYESFSKIVKIPVHRQK